MNVLRSVVKWFDAKKGYGFIVHPKGGSDIFIHYSQINSDADFKTLETGDVVEFELHDGPKGPYAEEVNAVDTEADDKDDDAPQQKAEQPPADGSAQDDFDEDGFEKDGLDRDGAAVEPSPMTASSADGASTSSPTSGVVPAAEVERDAASAS
jgi:CspA family cold shock protein